MLSKISSERNSQKYSMSRFTDLTGGSRRNQDGQLRAEQLLLTACQEHVFAELVGFFS